MAGGGGVHGSGRISRRRLGLYVDCPRCFWLEARYDIKQPQGFPMALNIAMDNLLKVEFDEFRARGEPHPLLVEHGVSARLFPDLAKLQEWRNNRKGLRWTDSLTGYTLFGAIDDLLEFPDGRLAVLDYKASGAAEAKVYPSYQLQLDVYTYLLQRMGYPTAPKAYLAYFLAVKVDGFRGRLPFKGTILEVEPQTERVGELFRDAISLLDSQRAPEPGEACEVCRWYDQADEVLGTATAGRLGGGADDPA